MEKKCTIKISVIRGTFWYHFLGARILPAIWQHIY